MPRRTLAKLEIELIGKEKEHYETLEGLWAFGVGKDGNPRELAEKISSTVSDWDRLRGGGEQISTITAQYANQIQRGDRQAASQTYLYLSPVFFFIRALGRMARKDWRETVTACGIFCERIIRNLMQEIDRKYGTVLWDELKDAKLNQQNGRLRSELESRGFEAANLYGSIYRIYSVRSTRGPHDVPPPEPIQAKISVTECLPVYVDYLTALAHVGVLLPNPADFIEIFSDTTRVQPNLVFGEEISGAIPFKDFLTDVIYREGFFKDGSTSAQVLQELARRRRNYDDATVKNGLRDLSTGKDAILFRKKEKHIFRYFERVPPEEYFRLAV